MIRISVQAGSAVARQSRDVQQLISEGVDVPVAKDGHFHQILRFHYRVYVRAILG